MLGQVLEFPHWLFCFQNKQAREYGQNWTAEVRLNMAAPCFPDGGSKRSPNISCNSTDQKRKPQTFAFGLDFCWAGFSADNTELWRTWWRLSITTTSTSLQHWQQHIHQKNKIHLKTQRTYRQQRSGLVSCPSKESVSLVTVINYNSKQIENITSEKTKYHERKHGPSSTLKERTYFMIRTPVHILHATLLLQEVLTGKSHDTQCGFGLNEKIRWNSLFCLRFLTE